DRRSPSPSAPVRRRNPRRTGLHWTNARRTDRAGGSRPGAPAFRYLLSSARNAVVDGYRTWLRHKPKQIVRIVKWLINWTEKRGRWRWQDFPTGRRLANLTAFAAASPLPISTKPLVS